jgi:hypothetical protein
MLCTIGWSKPGSCLVLDLVIRAVVASLVASVCCGLLSHPVLVSSFCRLYVGLAADSVRELRTVLRKVRMSFVWSVSSVLLLLICGSWSLMMVTGRLTEDTVPCWVTGPLASCQSVCENMDRAVEIVDLTSNLLDVACLDRSRLKVRKRQNIREKNSYLPNTFSVFCRKKSSFIVLVAEKIL